MKVFQIGVFALLLTVCGTEHASADNQTKGRVSVGKYTLSKVNSPLWDYTVAISVKAGVEVEKIGESIVELSTSACGTDLFSLEYGVIVTESSRTLSLGGVYVPTTKESQMVLGVLKCDTPVQEIKWNPLSKE